jgi:endonuclease/exonuclease/phosphatase family metal-dependent hydrolase
MSERKLRIATWNVERPNLTTPKQSERVGAVNAELKKYPADIFILTETNECISPGRSYNVHHSEPLDKEAGGDYYKEGERRISIWSVYPIIDTLKVKNPLTTACAVLQTPFGNLAVFGCIIGIHGIRDGFDTDLKDQIEDLRRFAAKGYNICYAGDFNLSFCDSYYTKISAMNKLNELFSFLKMKNLTAEIPEMIDHIVVSESFHSISSVEIECWNMNKKAALPRLSDHKGVAVTIYFKSFIDQGTKNNEC